MYPFSSVTRSSRLWLMSTFLLCLLMAACGGGEPDGDDALPLGQGQASQETPGPFIQAAASGTDAQAAMTPFAVHEPGPEAVERALTVLAPPQGESEVESGDMQVASALVRPTDGPIPGSGDSGSAGPPASDPGVQAVKALAVAQSSPQRNADGGPVPSAGPVPQGQVLTPPPREAESSADILAEPARGIVAPNRLAREDWPGLAARMGQSPEVANFVESQRRLVDTWAARNRERSDLVGGWIHDYIDPKTGAPLVWKEDSPEPPASKALGEDRFKEAWVTYVRYRNINYTLSAARIFRASGERTYADWAMRQLDFYADNYELWPLRTVDGRSRMFREGLAEATTVFTLLEAARLLGDVAGAKRQQHWSAHLFRPIAANLKSMTYPMTNVGLWHQAAIAAIGMHLRDEGLVQYALGNPQGIRAILGYGLTPDYLWIEGTFGYNAYVIECLAKLLTHASIEGYADGFAPEWLAARRLLLSPIDYRFDDGTLPVAGDTTTRVAAIDPATHWQLYRVVPSFWGTERARVNRTWEALIDPPVSFPGGAPAVPTATTRNFPSVRMAVLRAGAWQAYVHYGQAVGTHAQEEALTFELHDGKTPISAGSGTVSYSSPYHTRYFRRGAAHNVPLIDGVGQAKWEKGSIVDFSHRDSRLVVSQPDYNRAASAEREYRVTASGFVETTRIALKGVAPQPARLGEAFHTDCAVEPGVGLAPAPGLQLPGADPLTFWKVRSRHTAAGPWSVHLKCDGRTYRLGVTGSGAQRVFLATAPTTPLPAQTNVVYYDTTSTDTTFRVEITALP